MIGILLIGGLVYSNSPDISEISEELYEKAMGLEDIMANQIWNGFKISEYPLAMRKGDNEYVFYNGDITKRKAALEVYACTALKVDGEINIFMLQFEDMDSIMSPTGISTDSSNENHYIATIFHEGFHAYQWEYSNVFENVNFELYDEINSIFAKIDNDESIKTMYENEMKILYNGINEIDKSKKEELVKAYIAEREKRNEVLKEKLDFNELETLKSAENLYELIEGTAHYMEIKTIEVLNDKDRYEKLIDSLNRYHRNNVKYYKSGMGISLLLDELDDNWKDSVFKDDKPLFEKLNDAIGR
jgi:hypothetical protein